ncbi:MAG TPA: double zinc ribbon domain-containing protein [Baekduia sp.]|nr:double zinc ribbon domain-containing protein [Baekduia sp.]
MFAALLAPTCAACGAPVVDRRHLLCSDCDAAMPWLTQPCCARCALPLPCAPCPARRQAFSNAWAAAAHDGPARRLVIALKLRAAVGLADELGREIADRAPAALFAGAVLVPVPADPWRRRYRGLDHALLIACAVGRHTGLAVTPVLKRIGPAPRQSGQSRRVRTIGGRIAVQATGPVPAICTLVDDVHTTGSTLDVCAKALLQAGASEVRALTYGRALR